MKTFEYKQVSLVERDKVIEVADRLGSSGWELVSVTPAGARPLAPRDLYFKREIATEALFPAVVLGPHVSAPNNACLDH